MIPRHELVWSESVRTYYDMVKADKWETKDYVDIPVINHVTHKVRFRSHKVTRELTSLSLSDLHSLPFRLCRRAVLDCHFPGTIRRLDQTRRSCQSMKLWDSSRSRCHYAVFTRDGYTHFQSPGIQVLSQHHSRLVEPNN